MSLGKLVRKRGENRPRLVRFVLPFYVFASKSSVVFRRLRRWLYSYERLGIGSLGEQSIQFFCITRKNNYFFSRKG